MVDKNKQRRKRKAIVTGVIFGATILGCGYVIYSKSKALEFMTKRCNVLEKRVNQNETDIELLRDVMADDIIGTLKESLKRRLRYHEGRLNNAFKNLNEISAEDIKLHKEEIELISKQLAKVNSAETRLLAH